MSYLSKNLSVIAYANGFTMWHYTTTDTEISADHFNEAGESSHPASDFLRAGDMIIANYDSAGDIKIAQLLVKKVGEDVVEFVVMGGVPSVMNVVNNYHTEPHSNS